MSGPVRFDTSIAVVLRDDLARWQPVDVVAFLASGIAGAVPKLLGEPYADADGSSGALVGFAVHGPRNAVDEVVRGAHMHP